MTPLCEKIKSALINQQNNEFFGRIDRKVSRNYELKLTCFERHTFITKNIQPLFSQSSLYCKMPKRGLTRKIWTEFHKPAIFAEIFCLSLHSMCSLLTLLIFIGLSKLGNHLASLNSLYPFIILLTLIPIFRWPTILTLSKLEIRWSRSTTRSSTFRMDKRAPRICRTSTMPKAQ